jgi:hypothetical protein
MGVDHLNSSQGVSHGGAAGEESIWE